MGVAASKEQQVTTALENQDAGELRTVLKDMTSEQIRALCKSFVPSDENECTILHFAVWQGKPPLGRFATRTTSSSSPPQTIPTCSHRYWITQTTSKYAMALAGHR